MKFPHAYPKLGSIALQVEDSLSKDTQSLKYKLELYQNYDSNPNYDPTLRQDHEIIFGILVKHMISFESDRLILNYQARNVIQLHINDQK